MLIIALWAFCLFFVDTNLDLELMEHEELSATTTSISVYPHNLPNNSAVLTGLPAASCPSFNNVQPNEGADEDDLPHDRGLDIQDNWVSTFVSCISFDNPGASAQIFLMEPLENLIFSPQSLHPLLL